ncbi:ImmA/IrrE family metallo-endopeptidase [Enterococcus devriesei]|uniref:ImmA/IrrE family metallo-endopeptidase n=1 Tax=Enterococcus devriesei TaxID=319970 RepID=UPI001C10843E|nr:ImmA/IrrE family metallo-endopeptidase [Enterococcus devriesei]MBU5366788.1 ImmA/IrrE family metallo-endopeptidase [Enterococcus devriesei]
MSARVSVNRNVLEWAVRQSGKTLPKVQERFPKFDEWLEQQTSPTFNQLVDFSSFTKIPFGYLVLQEVPRETLPLLEFRTVETEEIHNPSRELVDTIKDMEKKQNWMREYLIDENYSSNKLVGALEFSEKLSILEVARFIRENYRIPILWYKQINSKTNSFDYLKEKISAQGILVMQNGTALGNTHRLLDVSEFRAFALIDDYAPLIFINTKDTLSGKIFSTFHELVHLTLGESSLYNKQFYNGNKFKNSLEIFCNAVAAELIIPENSFENEWNSSEEKDTLLKIDSLAIIYKISPVVIARKALDKKLISREIYTIVSDQAKKNAMSIKTSSSGGNPIYTAQSRLDKNFIYALSNGLDKGFAVYTDIYKLTGLSRNVFEKVEQNIVGGGV